MVDSLSKDCPNDWIERKVYSAHSRLGILLMLVIDLVLFGPWGLVVWGIQMIWIPFFAAGVVNGLSHWWGYRNTDTKDTSRNLIPWAVWIGGEELHNNHHADGANAKFSQRWWEFDLGWMYICILRFFKLATVR
jgi:stearoyl-CoA desaturase (delta-9 desaturase)